MEEIKKYFKNKGLNDVVIERLIKPYCNHQDIVGEFEYYIKNNSFVKNNPITECGYTAQVLYEKYNNKLDISGVFAMLITLREKPEEGLKIISENFPVK